MATCLGIKVQALDAAGAPLALGKIYTYAPGGTTPKATYSDVGMLVQHDNPVVLDAGGQAEIYLSGTTKFVVKTAAGVTVSTVDKVEGASAANDAITVVNLDIDGAATVTADLDVTGSSTLAHSLTIGRDLSTIVTLNLYGSVNVAGLITVADRINCSVGGACNLAKDLVITDAAGAAAITDYSIFWDTVSGKMAVKETGSANALY